MRQMILGGLSILLLSTIVAPGAKAEPSNPSLYAPRAQSLSIKTPAKPPADSSNLYAPRTYHLMTPAATNPATFPAQGQAESIMMNGENSALTRYNYLRQQLGLQAAQPQLSSWIKAEKPQLQAAMPTKMMSMSHHKPAFSAVPRLLRTSASQKGTYVPSVYEFTLHVPENAGEPLKAIRIAQANNVETVKFDISNSTAFTGEQLTAETKIPLSRIGGAESDHPGEVTIAFERPVEPGNTVTVALETVANPSWEGIYLFGVTAFPGNENGMSQFLGYGRIHIYGNSN